MISYGKLWKKLKNDKVSQYRLQMEGISNSTLTRLKRNENVSTDTLNKLCRILQCDIGDIAEYIEDAE